MVINRNLRLKDTKYLKVIKGKEKKCVFILCVSVCLSGRKRIAPRNPFYVQDFAGGLTFAHFPVISLLVQEPHLLFLHIAQSSGFQPETHYMHSVTDAVLSELVCLKLLCFYSFASTFF